MLNKIINDDEQEDEYQSPYVRSNVCPNDEYLLMIFEDGIQQEIKCGKAIHSSPELNFYQIVFNDQTKKFECKLIGTEHQVAQEYFNPIDFSHVNVDLYMEQYFIEQDAIDDVDGLNGLCTDLLKALDLDPQQRRRSSQRGQKRKGIVPKQSKLTNNPQQPIIIPDVHQIGQNELSQRMLQFMQLLPRGLPQAQHSHQFFTQNPTGICIMDGPQVHHFLHDVPSHRPTGTIVPNPQERGKLPTIQETTEDELTYNKYMDFLQSDYGPDIHLGFQRFMQERGKELLGTFLHAYLNSGSENLGPRVYREDVVRSGQHQQTGESSNNPQTGLNLDQTLGHPSGHPSINPHHGSSQHYQQQGGSTHTEQLHYQGQYPSEGSD
uniref:Uncharacterized protein n=1 Tax=Meloidogyne floridensis TaxID=298350 RepID=A0A915P3V2_9BILA